MRQKLSLPPARASGLARAHAEHDRQPTSDDHVAVVVEQAAEDLVCVALENLTSKPAETGERAYERTKTHPQTLARDSIPQARSLVAACGEDARALRMEDDLRRNMSIVR